MIEIVFHLLQTKFVKGKKKSIENYFQTKQKNKLVNSKRMLVSKQDFEEKKFSLLSPFSCFKNVFLTLQLDLMPYPLDLVAIGILLLMIDNVLFANLSNKMKLISNFVVHQTIH